MICTKCEKSFENALELYNGNIACPNCGHDLASVKEFKITEESEERFRLSETFFYRSLELSNKNINGRPGETDRKKIETEWRENIDNAIKHCRIAAAAGHPEAYWRMGFYYDKDYAGVGSTEVQRCRIAYNFYAALCYYDRFKELKIDGNSSAIKYNNEMFDSLRRRAANDLLIMLYNAPENLGMDERFGYAKNREKLVSIYDRGIGPAEGDRPGSGTAQSQAAVTLAACLGKTRVPLFGYFYLSPSDLTRLVDAQLSKDPERRIETIYPVLGKDIMMVYFPCKNEKRAVDTTKQEVYSEAEPLFRYRNNEHGGYLCFINRNGSFMPDKSLPKKVEPRLKGSNYSLFRSLINAQTVDGSAYLISGLTFYGDDVIKYKKANGCSYSDAVAALCADAQKNH
ncbi:MAG: hypothetical protein J1F39_02645 [Clostridiales bacterium]|nr:hypothetical protein [Clostridiales bacterium]